MNQLNRWQRLSAGSNADDAGTAVIALMGGIGGRGPAASIRTHEAIRQDEAGETQGQKRRG